MQDDCITIALRMPEVGVVWEEETDTEITVEVGYRASSAPCPWCGQETFKLHGVRCQRKRDRPAAGRFRRSRSWRWSAGIARRRYKASWSPD